MEISEILHELEDNYGVKLEPRNPGTYFVPLIGKVVSEKYIIDIVNENSVSFLHRVWKVSSGQKARMDELSNSLNKNIRYRNQNHTIGSSSKVYQMFRPQKTKTYMENMTAIEKNKELEELAAIRKGCLFIFVLFGFIVFLLLRI